MLRLTRNQSSSMRMCTLAEKLRTCSAHGVNQLRVISDDVLPACKCVGIHHTATHAYVHNHTYMHAMHACVHACIPTYIHIHTRTCSYIHTDIHIHIQPTIYTYIYTCTHIHIHAYIQMCTYIRVCLTLCEGPVPQGGRLAAPGRAPRPPGSRGGDRAVSLGFRGFAGSLLPVFWFLLFLTSVVCVSTACSLFVLKVGVQKSAQYYPLSLILVCLITGIFWGL